MQAEIHSWWQVVQALPVEAVTVTETETETGTATVMVMAITVAMHRRRACTWSI
jgi:hypothetical protein